jgi:hypothetical protein
MDGKNNEHRYVWMKFRASYQSHTKLVRCPQPKKITQSLFCLDTTSLSPFTVLDYREMRVLTPCVTLFVLFGCKNKGNSCTSDDIKLLNEQKPTETSPTCQDCLRVQTASIQKSCEHVCPLNLVECAKCFMDGPNPIKECS